MTRQRPGVRSTNEARRLLDRLCLDETPYAEDIAAAQAYALIGLAEAAGAIALAISSPPTPAPTAETGDRP